MKGRMATARVAANTKTTSGPNIEQLVKIAQEEEAHALRMLELMLAAEDDVDNRVVASADMVPVANVSFEDDVEETPTCPSDDISACSGKPEPPATTCWGPMMCGDSCGVHVDEDELLIIPVRWGGSGSIQSWNVPTGEV